MALRRPAPQASRVGSGEGVANRGAELRNRPSTGSPTDHPARAPLCNKLLCTQGSPIPNPTVRFPALGAERLEAWRSEGRRAVGGRLAENSPWEKSSACIRKKEIRKRRPMGKGVGGG